MIWLLKWYYGYKNFGDEVLLLGVIPYLFQQYTLTHLYIEAADTERLKTRLDRHESFLGGYHTSLSIIEKHSAKNYAWDELFLWGGEVLTDGRPFPYNWRNYLLRYPQAMFSWSYHLLWGIGTPRWWLSAWLWKLLVGQAKTVVVRETRSYAIASALRAWKRTVQYHDFAEDVLPKVIQENDILDTEKNPLSTTILLNTNPYIRSSETKQKLITFADGADNVLYFPAEIGVDDRFYNELAVQIPGLVLYDRTTHTLAEICSDITRCSGVMAARLHVLWLAKLLHIPFEPLVYQEKISTFLEQCSGESS